MPSKLIQRSDCGRRNLLASSWQLPQTLVRALSNSSAVSEVTVSEIDRLVCQLGESYSQHLFDFTNLGECHLWKPIHELADISLERNLGSTSQTITNFETNEEASIQNWLIILTKELI